MIDLHSHVLPGLDDGAASLEDALEVLRLSTADGVCVLAATPHVRDDYPTTSAEMESGLAIVRQAASAAGIPIELLPGGEISLEKLVTLDPLELARFALAGNPEFLLVEFPLFDWPFEFDHHVSQLIRRGIRPVLAHPERNPEVQSAPERLRPLVNAGALVQITASSLASSRRGATWKTAHRLIDSGLAHLAATDAHGSTPYRHGLRNGYAAIRNSALADWLTTAMPGAIVRGEPLPARPMPERAQRRLPALLRRRASPPRSR